METVGKIATGLVILVFGIIFGGWVLSVLWGWIVVPIFAAPALTVAHGVGLKTMFAYFTIHSTDAQDKTKPTMTRLAKAMGVQVCYGLIALLSGWIIHYFI